MKEVRIGDRFKNKHGYGTWEFLYKKSPDKYYCKCIHPATTEHYYTNKAGDIDFWALNNTNAWEYIGNFSKSDSFTELYNLFNS